MTGTRPPALDIDLSTCGGDGDGAAKKKGPPEKPFGSSTPSSKIPIKPNAEEEAKRCRGGRPAGHEGAGRSSIQADEADVVEESVPDSHVCPPRIARSFKTNGLLDGAENECYTYLHSKPN